MRRTLFLALAVLVSVFVVPTGTVAQGAVFSPGAPGIGDPYFPLDGNGGYDVASYDLALTYTPNDNRLAGTATIAARATQDLSRFNLDFHAMTVRAIAIDGVAATWTRSGDELVVTPATGIANGSSYTVVVRYDGVPDTLGSPLLGTSGFIHTNDGAIVIGEPDVAATWFPVNDHPRDKASYVFRISVPDGLEVVANGVPAGQSSSGGLTTWTWRAVEPMAPYLATINVGEFTLRSRTVDGIRYVDAVDPDLFGSSTGSVISGSFKRQPEILAFLETVFGPYPFSAAGGLVDDTTVFGFALENQTRPIYSRFFFSSRTGAESVIAHELAHQWYGDSVAVDAWRHIWLNEGFATYAQWLWSEEEGLGTAEENFRAAYSRGANDPFWDIIVGDPGPSNLFSSAIYDRGAMTLHELRLEVGDPDFFEILQSWAAGQAEGNGTTDEFIALAETVSGQQLDAFFDAWLFTPSKPARG